MGHIGRMDNTSVSGYRGRWLKSSAVPVCGVLEQDTLSSLLLLTQLISEYENIVVKGVCSVLWAFRRNGTLKSMHFLLPNDVLIKV